MAIEFNPNQKERFPRWMWACSLLFGALFGFLTFSAANTRGLVAEECQPFLFRHPIVLEQRKEGALQTEQAEQSEDADIEGSNSPLRITKMPPYEDGAPKAPRWVATSQWPVLAYEGKSRTWPLFIRGHQSALGSYPGILLGPLLGEGIYGPRRATALLGLLIVLLTPLLSFRLGASKWAALASGILVSISFGMISIASTSYSFEVASRAFMMLSLYVLAKASAPTRLDAALSGFLGALSILCRATIGAALLPAMLVLVLRKESRPKAGAALLLAIMTIGLPIFIVLILHSFLPFREGTAPLSDFPIAQLPARLLSLPRTALVTLAFLGDASSIWAPISLGHTRLSSGLFAPAWLCFLVFIAALYRFVRGSAGLGERLYLFTFLSSILAGALLYGNPEQFQLALALEPMLALSLGEQIAALFAMGEKKAGFAIVFCALAARGHGLYEGLRLDSQNKNPMFSEKAQKAAVLRLRELSIAGPELLTTVYNQAGVIEARTGGIDGQSDLIRPFHAWPLFSGLSQSPNDCAHQAAWRTLLYAQKPRFVLLSEGPNIYETGSTDVQAIARSLRRVAGLSGISLLDEGHFETEGRGPGWALLGLGYSDENRLEFKADPACEKEDAELFRLYSRGRAKGERVLSFYGLRVGDRFGDFVLTRIFAEKGENAQGALTHIVLSKNTINIEFELKAVPPDSPPPPARGGPWGVYYRNRDMELLGAQSLIQLAEELSQVLSAYEPPIIEILAEPIKNEFETKRGIEYLGRFEESDQNDKKGPVFSFPGPQIKIRFEGRGADIKLLDPQGHNQFFVIVDGGRPRLFKPQAGEHAYTVAQALNPGLHELLLYKRGESFWGPVQFLGVFVHAPGRLLEEAQKSLNHREKTIEIIGDSISCGYGIEGDSPTCPFTASTQSEYDSYGALAARALGARHMNICYSGKGIYRSFQGITEDQMPDIYRRTLADKKDARWDFSRFSPDIIVINLGTNDFAKGDPGPPFEEAYKKFLVELRQIHPEAHVLCALGPMLSGENLESARRRILSVVAARKNEGDGKIHFIEFPNQSIAGGAACDWHPNRETHRVAAKVLEERLRSLWNP